MRFFGWTGVCHEKEFSSARRLFSLAALSPGVGAGPREGDGRARERAGARRRGPAGGAMDRFFGAAALYGRAQLAPGPVIHSADYAMRARGAERGTSECAGGPWRIILCR